MMRMNKNLAGMHVATPENDVENDIVRRWAAAFKSFQNPDGLKPVGEDQADMASDKTQENGHPRAALCLSPITVEEERLFDAWASAFNAFMEHMTWNEGGILLADCIRRVKKGHFYLNFELDNEGEAVFKELADAINDILAFNTTYPDIDIKRYGIEKLRQVVHKDKNGTYCIKIFFGEDKDPLIDTLVFTMNKAIKYAMTHNLEFKIISDCKAD